MARVEDYYICAAWVICFFITQWMQKFGHAICVVYVHLTPVGFNEQVLFGEVSWVLSG